jgi:coenzyme F420-reducing hydrogenase delta subunit
LAARATNPRILAFVCSWHPLTAADNAGVDRRSYGTATTIVPVECAGVVTAASILRAFTRKMDGVLVAACGRGDCHYSNGNESCERVIEETCSLMELAGIAPQRLRLDLSSEVGGEQFVALLDEFAAEVSKLNGRARRGRAARTRKVAKRAPAKKKLVAKRTRATKAPAKKAAPKKVRTKKATSKTTAAKQARAKKTAAKKVRAKKTAAKTPARRKSAARAKRKR